MTLKWVPAQRALCTITNLWMPNAQCSKTHLLFPHSFGSATICIVTQTKKLGVIRLLCFLSLYPSCYAAQRLSRINSFYFLSHYPIGTILYQIYIISHLKYCLSFLTCLSFMMTLKCTFSHSIRLCWYIVKIFVNKPKNQEVVKLNGNIINPEVIKSVGNGTVSSQGLSFTMWRTCVCWVS